MNNVYAFSFSCGQFEIEMSVQHVNLNLITDSSFTLKYASHYFKPVWHCAGVMRN